MVSTGVGCLRGGRYHSFGWVGGVHGQCITVHDEVFMEVVVDCEKSIGIQRDHIMRSFVIFRRSDCRISLHGQIFLQPAHDISSYGLVHFRRPLSRSMVHPPPLSLTHTSNASVPFQLSMTSEVLSPWFNPHRNHTYKKGAIGGSIWYGVKDFQNPRHKVCP